MTPDSADSARTPLISVCVPTHNGAPYLRQCLESALGQTWRDFELLIADDGSTDETVAIAREYARRDARVRLHANERNLGLVGNWNRCAALARGAWIKFLFQDDYLEPGCLARMLEVSRPGVPLVVTRRVMRFEAGTPEALRRIYEQHASRWTIPGFFGHGSQVAPAAFAAHMVERPTLNCIGEPTAILLHRSAFQRFGGFNPDLLVLADWEYAARVAIHTGLAYADEPLATFRVQSRSASQTRRARRRFRVEVLDGLILEHDLAYAPVYEPVRLASRSRRHPIDLRHRLVESSRRARRAVRRYAEDPTLLDPGAPREWAWMVSRYPRLTTVPPGYALARAATMLRRARWTVLARAERAIARLATRPPVRDP